MAAANDKPEAPDIITVGKVNDDSRAVWDRHPLHPANYGEGPGEVFISDMRPYEVHRSRGIQQKIGEKELREIGERDAQRRTSEYEKAQQERQRQREEAQESMTSAGTFVQPGVVPVEEPQLTAEQAAAAQGSSGATIPESEQHDADDPDDGSGSGGGRQVRRPKPGGPKPDR